MRWVIDGVDDLNRVAKEFLASTGDIRLVRADGSG